MNGYFHQKLIQFECVAASLAALSTGTVLGWTAQISQSLLDGELGFSISEDELGWTGSFMSLGAASLSLFTGNIAGYFGTKRTMIIMAIVITLGWIQIILASSVLMLYFGRFITGMIAGAFCVTVPLYTNEISQKEIRGSLGCFTQLMISSGILFATIVGKFLNIRNYTIVCGVLPLIFGCIFVFMPETPAFLLKQNNREAAKASLKKLRGKYYNFDAELKEIESTLEEREIRSISKFKECIKKSSIQRACFVGMGLMSFKVFCGIDAITTYLSLTLETAEMDIDVQYGTIIFSFIQTICAVLQTFVVDRLGRRVLLLFSEIVMTLCLYLAAIAFLFRKFEIFDDCCSYINYLPLIAFCVFTIGFSMGIGPIPFMMCAEIFPSEIRNYMASFCNFWIWSLTFAIVKSFMVMSTSIGPYSCFFMFAGLSTVGIFFVYFFVPETKGLTLAQVQEKFVGKVL